ncbi:MAG: Trk family potassium uptake protein [Chloroflexi bacterium]|nr:Trk family potassium uptake protein [Chloroflexota bacterium]
MMIVYSYVVLASVGAGLLMLPWANTLPGFSPFKTTIFTAISAITVTGLTVVDTATYWSDFGHAVIFGLILFGGLGFLTSAAFLLILLGQRIGLQNLLVLREGVGVRQIGGLDAWVRNVVLAAVGIQAIGTAVLFLKFYVWQPLWDGIAWREALWLAAFHAVSAFNNAGFDIMPADRVGGVSLTGFRGDYAVLGAMGFLVVLGGISYSVIQDVFKNRGTFWRFRLETKLVLMATALLLVIGMVTFLGFEYSRPETIGNLNVFQKISNSALHSVMTRTAGFNTIDYAETSRLTNLVASLLMFIGGASTSTAGGIKVGTAVVINLGIWQTLTGRRHIRAFKREIPEGVIRRAMVVVLISIGLVALFVFLMVATEGKSLYDTLFEVLSAFNTVGLSTGITGTATEAGRAILMAAMFIGRFGPLALALWMIGPPVVERYRYLEEEVRIG